MPVSGKTEHTDLIASVVAFEGAMRRIEIHQILTALVRSGALSREHAVDALADIHQAVAELPKTPLMKAAAETALRHYQDMASMVMDAS